MRWAVAILLAIGGLSVGYAAARLTESGPSATPPILARDLLLRESTPDLEFVWRVPLEVGLIPPLWRTMRTEAEKTLAEARASVASKPVIANTLPLKEWYREEWATKIDTPRLLVLTGTIEAFTGGDYERDDVKQILWDKAAGRRIRFADLFTSWDEAKAAIGSLYCAELQKELAYHRTGKARKTAVHCPNLGVRMIMLMGLREGSREGIGKIRVWPASGDVVGPIDIWPSEAVLALVRPAYRADWLARSE